jgi:hypothetical protein
MAPNVGLSIAAKVKLDLRASWSVAVLRPDALGVRHNRYGCVAIN